MKKANLLKETMNVLTYHQKSKEDVKFVTVEDVTCSWNEFETVACEVDYDTKCDVIISRSLFIVGDTWYLKRNYAETAFGNMNEWWDFIELPKEFPRGKLTKALIFNQHQNIFMS